MKAEKTTKKQKKFISILLLCIGSPLLLFALFLFAGHGFEPIFSHFRQINEETEPLLAGDCWEEESFTVTLEQLRALPLAEWNGSLPAEFRDELVGGQMRLYEMQFSFENLGLKGATASGKRTGGMTVHTWVCGRDAADRRDNWPLEECSATGGIFGLQGETQKSGLPCGKRMEGCRYVFAVPEQVTALDICFRVPAGWGRYYKQGYQVLLPT